MPPTEDRLYQFADAIADALRRQPIASQDFTIVIVEHEIRTDMAGRPAVWDRLTDREQAVAALAAQGFTNRQIARQTFTSPHTVNYHLRNIFRKLAIGSRVQLAHTLAGVSGPARPAPLRP
jgi:DNA-binding NarL/FixJ family response regulator